MMMERIIVLVLFLVSVFSVDALMIGDLTDGHKMQVTVEECNNVAENEGRSLCLLRATKTVATEQPGMVVHEVGLSCEHLEDSLARKLCEIRQGVDRARQVTERCSQISETEGRRLCEIRYG